MILWKEHCISTTDSFTNWLCDSELVKPTISYAFIYFRQIASEKKAVAHQKACVHRAWNLRKEEDVNTKYYKYVECYYQNKSVGSEILFSSKILFRSLFKN